MTSHENDFDGITLSLDGGASVIAVPPIIRASVLMLDKMLENQGKRQIIVFPERNQSTFIFFPEMGGAIFVCFILRINMYTWRKK